MNLRRKKYRFIYLAIFLFLVVASVLILSKTAGAPAGLPFLSSLSSEKKDDDKKPKTEQQAFDKSRYSLTDPNSIWVVVNKKRPLPAGFAPSDLVMPNIPRRSGGDEAYVSKKISSNLEALVAAAKKEGINLMLASGYRSYSLQTSVYNGYVKSMGQTEADKISAKPGTSEHQTGLALDIEPTNGQCEVEACFGDLPEGKWIAANAYKYGFIVRYQKGKESITGYSYEPWHLRYIGKELAAEMKRTGITTLEEFFSL